MGYFLFHFLRIIPAHAGNTSLVQGLKVMDEDHPRTCGEHYSPVVLSLCEPGSSPHMRGTLRIFQISQLILGIIPAHAGNTTFTLFCGKSVADHPRTCGEHSRNSSSVSMALGSSPHMRGTLMMNFWGKIFIGIIPAHAGNTNNCRINFLLGRDHPRTCGEHWLCRTGMASVRGSSPHMRGTPTVRVTYPASSGIIPAHAGNTSALSSTMSGVGDHPRTCGEHLAIATLADLCAGSSPHMRGTQEIVVPC